MPVSFRPPGVKSVINLSCVAHEAGFLGFGVLAREKELVESLGVQYRNIPINPLNVGVVDGVFVLFCQDIWNMF